MKLFEIYRTEARIRYYSNFISKAALVHFGSIILCILLTIAICYLTEGFYVKQNENHEFPDFVYSNDYFLVIRTNLKNYQFSNRLLDSPENKLDSTVRLPAISYREYNTNAGLRAGLIWKANFPLATHERVFAISLMIGFQYLIARTSMKSVAYLDYSSATPGNKLMSAGDLKFVQTRPIIYSESNSEFNVNNIRVYRFS